MVNISIFQKIYTKPRAQSIKTVYYLFTSKFSGVKQNLEPKNVVVNDSLDISSRED